MVLRLRATSLAGLLVLWCVLLSSLAPGAGAATAARSLPSAQTAVSPVFAAHRQPRARPRHLMRLAPHADTASTVTTSSLTSPLAFEPNVGQTDPQVRYLAHGPGYTLFLTDTAALLTFLAPTPAADPSSAPVSGTEQVLRLSYVGANPAPTLDTQDPLPGTMNYLLGSDPTAWHTGIATAAQVTVHGLYPGIDLLYHGVQTPTQGAGAQTQGPAQGTTGTSGQSGHLEWTYDVAPGADPSQILFDVQGAQGLRLDAAGNLVAQTVLGSFMVQAPIASQMVNGQSQPVAATFTLSGTTEVGLSLSSYDTSLPLVIDPVLGYSTYLGGNSDSQGRAIAVDSSGEAFVAGDTLSANFPVTPTGAFSTSLAGGRDAFVSKFNAAGSALVYSTYLGGSADDYGYGLALNSAGDAFVAGSTSSHDFPTSNAYQSHFGGLVDAYLTELNSSGSGLLYSTYLGGTGTDNGYAVAVDASGKGFVAGDTTSSNLPITPTTAYATSNAGGYDAFVSKVDPTKSGTASLLYSTYLGGSGGDHATGLTVGSATHAAVTGYTSSTDFPTLHALQSSRDGATDAFVTQLNAAGTALVYSTYLGGSSKDDGRGIAADSVGDLYVTGNTTSTDFLTTTGAFQPTYGGSGSSYGDLYMTKLDPSQSGADSLLYSTYLGGSGDDVAGGIAVDGAGSAYVMGNTLSTDFPTYAPIQGTCAGNPPCTHSDAFVAELDSSGGKLGYATFLGGSQSEYGKAIAVDGAGNAYVTGQTNSPDFPTTAGAYDTNYYDLGCDTCNKAFVSKISPQSSGALPWHPQRSFSLGDGLSIRVDVADGHGEVQTTDMAIPGRRTNLVVGRVWDSVLAQQGAAGGLQSSMTPHMGGVLTGTVVYTSADGSVWPFVYTGSLSATPPYTQYRTPAGLPWQLSTSSSGYTLTNILDSSTLTFNSAGLYLATTDAYGNAATLTYSGTEPITWTAAGGYGAPSGRALSLGYDGNGRLDDVQSPLWRTSGGSQGQHVTYGYNSSNQLTSLTRAAGTSDALTATLGYSGTSLLTTVTTPMGHQWLVAYDANGRVVSVTSPASGTVGQAGYSPANTTQFTYNAGQTQVVAGSGTSSALTTTYTLDAQGEATAIADGLGDTSAYSYDQDHNVTSSQDANGNITTNYFQYVGPNGSTGLITETVQPPIQPYSPLNGSRVSPTTLHYYNATNDLTETVQPAGGITLLGYDGHHSVITTTQLITGSTSWRGTVESYDADGQHSSTTDGRAISVSASGVASLIPSQVVSYTTNYTYTANGDLASASTPPITTTVNGHTATAPVTTTYGYNTDGDQTSMTRPNGNAPGSTPSSYSTTYSYDHLGRQTTIMLPPVTLYTGVLVTPTEQTSYDGEGHVVQQTDANGAVTTDSYDPQGSLVSEINPVSGTTLYTYTATELVAQSDPMGQVTSYGYDAAGRQISLTEPATGTIQTAYDAVGNTIAVTSSPAGGAAITVDTRQYDALNRIITETVTGPGGPTLGSSTRYDLDGNVYQTVNPNGDAVVATYDLADEEASIETDPATVTAATHQQQSTFGYDAAGNQTLATDLNNDTTTRLLDANNRTVQTVALTSTSTITHQMTYDPDGNTLTHMMQTADAGEPLQTITDTSTYTANDWLTSFTDNGLTTSYGYDAAGRQRTQSIPGGQIATTLDAEGRTTALSMTGAGTASYGYNPDDQPISGTLPGGLSQSMTYNPNSQLTSWGYLGPSTGVTTTTVNLAYNYAYDGANRTNALTITDNSVAQSEPITQDAAGRLIGWTGPNGAQTWGYDANGNITSTYSMIAGQFHTTVFTHTTSFPNELVQEHTDGFGVATYTRDGYGNTTSEVSNDQTSSPLYVNKHLSYDAQEQTITQTNVQNGATITVTMGFNPEGQRITYTAVMSGQVVSSEQFSYRADGSIGQLVAMTATLNGNGSIQSSGSYTDTYAYDPQGAPLFLVRQVGDPSTTAYSYLSNGLGDVIGLVDGSGTRLNSYQYDPYGLTIGRFEETVPQIFRVAGALFDAQTGFNFIGGSSVDFSGVTDQPRTVSGSRDYHEFGDNRFSTKGHRYFIWAAAFIAPPSIKFWYPWFTPLSIGFQPDAHFHGDNRGFWNGASQPPSAGKNNFFASKQSSRVWNAVLINTDPNLSNPVELNESGVGQTVVRYSDYGLQRTVSGYATAPPPASVSVYNSSGGRNIDVNINANAGIPVIWGAPTIQYNYSIDIAQTPGHADVISAYGYHTAFPWQELLIDCIDCAAGHRDRVLSSASAPFQYSPAPGANPLSLASMFIYWPGAVVLHP